MTNASMHSLGLATYCIAHRCRDDPARRPSATTSSPNASSQATMGQAIDLALFSD